MNFGFSKPRKRGKSVFARLKAAQKKLAKKKAKASAHSQLATVQKQLRGY